MCLPKFNPTGFVNAYVSFLRRGGNNEKEMDAQTIASSDAEITMSRSNADDIALICISGGGEFETIRNWCESVCKVRKLFSLDLFFLNVRGQCRNWKRRI